MLRREFLAIVVATAAALALCPGCAPEAGFSEVELQGQKVLYKASGNGLRAVSVTFRRLGGVEATVRVPPGTYFESTDPYYQSMVATHGTTACLRDDQPIPLRVPAVCVDRPKCVPVRGVRFRLQPEARPELANLMAALAKMSTSFDAIQAAVWILEDNADYEALGILIQRRGATILGRAILEYEAAQGMRFLEGAGVDITRRAIWRDRQAILQALPEGELKTWLGQRAGL